MSHLVAAPPPSGAPVQLALPREFFPRRSLNCGFVPPPYLVDSALIAETKPPATVKTLEERIAELTDEQRQILKEFRVAVHESGAALGWADDWTLIRYLVARNFVIKKALKMILASAEWHRTNPPERAVCDKCSLNPNAHMMHFVGWDLKHRPVLYISYRWALDRTVAHEGVTHSIELFQHAIRMMPQGVEQWVVCTDFVTYSHWKDGSPEQARGVIGVLQSHYPERLGLYVLIDPPTTFWIMWKLISPFIDTKTYNKVAFWYTAQEPNIATEFPKVFPPHLSKYLHDTFQNNKAPIKP